MPTRAARTTPPAQRTPKAAAATLLAMALLLACDRAPEPVAQDRNRLIVAVRPGPTSWFPGPEGTPAGFDHDLVARFAREQGLALDVVEVDSAGALLARVAAGEAHMGVGGLYASPPPSGDPAATGPGVRPVLWTRGYHAVEPVVVYSTDGYRPRSWQDLAGAEVGFVDATGIDEQLAHVRTQHPEVGWRPFALPSAEALIAQVAEGIVDYAVVPSIDAAAARNIVLDFDVAFVAGPPRDLAWAVAPTRPGLRDALDRFLAKAREDGVLARLADRHYGHAHEVARIDAGVFRERLKSVLPDYRRIFEDAQVATGIEWRFLAALAYQESQWDPFATSETGVRGFMQITEETARQLNIADPLEPRASTLGAARYIAALKGRLPPRIAEPDRTWLALAAFNIGMGHLEDARILAQRQNLDPDLWADVKRTLPLLALPEHYRTAKNGYARGGMPVVFVDRTRAYYDILVRHEGPLQPRLHATPSLAHP